MNVDPDLRARAAVRQDQPTMDAIRARDTMHQQGWADDVHDQAERDRRYLLHHVDTMRAEGSGGTTMSDRWSKVGVAVGVALGIAAGLLFGWIFVRGYAPDHAEPEAGEAGARQGELMQVELRDGRSIECIGVTFNGQAVGLSCNWEAFNQQPADE